MSYLAPAIFTSVPADLLVVLVIVLLFFGPKRLPGLGRSLGSGIREFKDGLGSGSGHDTEDQPEIAAKNSAGESGSGG
jgi:sec-independent protein translocase protein TatA